MNFEIPPGLTDLLQEFTVAVLRARPQNLEAFACEYFNKLNEKKNPSLKGNSIRFQTEKTIIKDNNNDTGDEDEDDDPPAPPQARDRRKSVSAERYDPEADDDQGYTKVVHPKSDDQRKRLTDAIKHILLFRSLDQEQMQEVLDAMFEKEVSPGQEIITQGDDGDNFYVIDNGKYDIKVNNKIVGHYNNEGFFGELALMYNMPRAATIVASSKGTVWGLDRQTFRRIVLKTAFNKRKRYEKLIEGCSMLKSLDMYERMNVCDALTSQAFAPGDKIITQGDKADCMYFVEEGEVRVAMINKADPKATVEKEINRIGPGGYFGELALVTNKPRAASVYAIGPVKCAVLDVHAFERLMGPCMNIMKRNIENYEAQLVQIFGNKSNISDLR
ncbi:cAMP-dependent protein kinase type II regulatory subunit-like isoform X4 [Biomphalaria glabrata]|uniref:cAMP-dependent protein kinase type II regulatory subunit n=1 Tax=Biomphalaria glabrata TaxID=6526 RepID=A0A9W3A6U5_BIOGL|nr:cAMP-dependent protein kinase type II regulatory subunit-like isoform X4 [Biomphalaria glabrata]